MLVEEGTDHVINELVLAVGDIQGEGGHEGDKGYEYQLAQQLKYKFQCFLHILSAFHQYASESSKSTSVGSSGSSPRTMDI